MTNKIVRTICLFAKSVNGKSLEKLDALKNRLIELGFEIQTVRICTPTKSILELDKKYGSVVDCLGIGKVTFATAEKLMQEFVNSKKVSMNVDLTDDTPNENHVLFLKNIIKYAPSNTFNFAFTFNNSASSPYFPSAQYEKDGFSIGLQPTDLAQECISLKQWLNEMEKTWKEIFNLFKNDDDFLGIDSSVAPIFSGKGSLINFIKKLGYSFSESTLSDTYTQITQFIKSHNPKPVGLCGLMLPCLEDFELADEYERGHFDIKTNLFLSLQSGLGIDTYPIGTDEDNKAILNIMRLTQKLSLKYSKPLSIRFVSDGKAKIGEKTNFNNIYLKDVVVKPLISQTN